ncbi:MAG: hypothetical protein CHACPFDD_00145 [Phycisphaerae bacterium]|nr:hypothetical protein [Phycisphaerae bacterium]
MLYALDLTRRQSNRVLEQALRTQAVVEIEPRNWPDAPPISGHILSNDGRQMVIALDDDGRALPIASFAGMFCDVKTMLSEQIYIFGASIVEASAQTVPHTLTLATPETVQVSNRRRFIRRTLARASQVEIVVDEGLDSFVGEFGNISGNGLSARVPREADDALLIGEPVRVRFAMPCMKERFDLRGILTNKTASPDKATLTIGVQFEPPATSDPRAAAAIERLRAFLCDPAFSRHETETGE